MTTRTIRPRDLDPNASVDDLASFHKALIDRLLDSTVDDFDVELRTTDTDDPRITVEAASPFVDDLVDCVIHGGW